MDLDELLVSQPDTGEQALDIMDMLVGSGAVDIIVVDSVAALVPRAEIEGDMGDSHVGLQARLMSQALRKITGRLAATNTTAIFINQLREKIGVFFGNPETTTGGKALKFYASVRVDIRRTGPIKNAAGETIGNRTKAKIVKNKMAPPFQQAEFDILYNVGINTYGELADLGVETDVIKKSGAYYSYQPDNGDEPVKAQGRGNFIDTLAQTDITTIQEIGNKIAAEIFPEVPYTAYGNKHTEPIIKYTPEDNPEPKEPTTNTGEAPSALDEEF